MINVSQFNVLMNDLEIMFVNTINVTYLLFINMLNTCKWIC